MAPPSRCRGAHVGRQQLASALQHHGAQHGALRERQPLPDGLEHRVLLGEQARQRRVQVRRAPALRPPAARTSSQVSCASRCTS